MIEGIIACLAMLGGSCAFIYYIFSSMEKRLETWMTGRFEKFEVKMDMFELKLNHLESTVTKLSSDMDVARARSDKLWEVLMSMTLEKPRGKKNDKA
jgi:hypothetical protein